jgi:Protein of unknown function (DUF4232)
MKLAFRVSRRIIGGSALIAAAALLPGTALAATAAPAASAATAKAAWFVPRCTIGQTKVTLGRGSGAAGTVFYPLRYTNVSARTCTMIGYPKTWAESQNGRIIGNASRKVSGRQRVITLVPSATAHSTLGIIEAGNICRKPATAVSLRVRAPQQIFSRLLRFKFLACHGHVTVMTVTPVGPGRG